MFFRFLLTSDLYSLLLSTVTLKLLNFFKSECFHPCPLARQKALLRKGDILKGHPECSRGDSPAVALRADVRHTQRCARDSSTFVLVSTPQTRELPDPSHRRLQLTRVPQDANMLEIDFTWKKRKNQSVPSAEPCIHSDPNSLHPAGHTRQPQDLWTCCLEGNSFLPFRS